MATIVVCDHDRVEGVAWQVTLRSTTGTEESASFDCCSRACVEACIAAWASE